MNKETFTEDSAFYFQYGKHEMEYLKRKDKKLGYVIDSLGHIKRKIMPDPFLGLLHAIVGQQISGKAQASIWRRFLETFGAPEPCNLACADLQKIKTCGISSRKATYMQNIAREFHCGRLDASTLSEMDDHTLSERLVTLQGVGNWTAQMLLIFTFQRMDVLSFGDLAILRGLRMLYRHKLITMQLFERYKKRYSPFSTVASFYLWELAGGALSLSDPAQIGKL